MTIPPPGQLATRRSSTRDRVAFAVSALATFALVMSVASILSIGVFIGVGAVPLFLMGVWLSPVRGRVALAILGVCWGIFCVVVLAVGSSL